tara:strand:+ start:16989 stop:17957 length:969 start_codon:yes stop_codon:yes gene_type:complete
MKKSTLIYLLLILCVACEQDEIAIDKHPIGEIEVTQINIGSDYSQQIFYNINENNIIGNNIKTDWDLAFRLNANESKIIINSSTFSQISKLENYNFNTPVILADLTWRWDNPNGVNFGTAFDNTENSTTYILDRGYNINGTSRGYKKIRIDSINSSSFFITYANIDNTNLESVEIIQDSLFNFQYFSFNTDTIINIEPRKDKWDLVFTQYTHLFTNNLETPAYLVTGVLTNYLNNVTIAIDSTNSFDDINLDVISNYTFSNDQDEIGYNWKTFDFDEQVYSVNTEIIYIIKDMSNRYFKMYFIDFYNDLGEKGHPKFVIQEL